MNKFWFKITSQVKKKRMLIHHFISKVIPILPLIRKPSGRQEKLNNLLIQGLETKASY